jgi:RNA recognition motif-containing protein
MPAGAPYKQQLPDECKLYVGNLPPAYDSAMLRQLFEPHARVVHSAVITDPGSGMSRGFGFIHIPDAAQVGSTAAAGDVVGRRCFALVPGQAVRT